MADMNSMESSDVTLSSSIQVEEDVEDFATVVHEMTGENFTVLLSEEIDGIKLQKLTKLLSGLRINVKTVKKLAKDIGSGELDPNDVLLNADPFTDAESQDVLPEMKNSLLEILKQCKAIMKMDRLHVIFVCADKNVYQRYSEQVNFLEKLIPGFSRESLPNNVKTYFMIAGDEDTVKSELKAYFGKEGYEGLSATGTLLSMIVFLGHGGKQGLRLANNQFMSLQTIVELTHKLCRDAVCTSTNGMPGACQLIFSQCFGHLYDQTKQSALSDAKYSHCFHDTRCDNSTSSKRCHRFGVVHFTSPGAEYTVSRKKKNSGQWKHIEASQFAKESASFIKKLVEFGTKESQSDIELDYCTEKSQMDVELFDLTSEGLDSGISLEEDSSMS